MLKNIPHDPDAARRPMIVDVIPLGFLPVGISFVLKGEKLCLLKKIDSLNYECESITSPRQLMLTATTVVVNPTWENQPVDVFQIEEWSLSQNYPLVEPKTCYRPSLN